jgi:hypothetical protein
MTEMRKPRRGYGDGGCRQRSPGTFELRYSVGVDEATGKRRIATLTVRGTAAEARAELRRRLEAVRKGEHVDPHRITVAGWLGTWLGAVRQEVAPTTYRRYREIVDHYLTPRLGQLPLLKLAPMHIQEAYNALGVDARRDGRPGVWRRAPVATFIASFRAPWSGRSSSSCSLATRPPSSGAGWPRSSAGRW